MRIGYGSACRARSDVSRILSQEGHMFTKSGRNHINFYINIINWKTKNCQICVNAQAPASRGGGTCRSAL